ncbi:ParA family protein [Carboxydochorda subterranea]|uniref:ParA family protein n=1 Tax=Carboxydichorda subterranea TaxID=3109565 RepID=A0ABZ1BUJ5_9FIRM|nr:ParA family protein [Limnochorda sp. L945t]WRP16442.1 ParA family protein [Limnochorda sp. L945t]
MAPAGHVIVVVNQKGGVAKTTSVFHLGAALAELGMRVLWVDLDPQAALSAWCGVAPDRSPNVYHGLLSRTPAGPILVEGCQGADLLPAGIELSLAELELVNQMAPERRLLRLLAELRDRYDYVLVDTQPSLGILTQNALVAADEVLIPVACEYLAVRVLSLVLRALGRVRVQANTRLTVAGILPTMYDGRTRHAREALEAVRSAFGARYRIFEWPVKKSIRFAEAAAQHRAVWEIAPDHPGGAAYRSVASVLAGRVPMGVPAGRLEEDETLQ